MRCYWGSPAHIQQKGGIHSTAVVKGGSLWWECWFPVCCRMRSTHACECRMHELHLQIWGYVLWNVMILKWVCVCFHGCGEFFQWHELACFGEPIHSYKHSCKLVRGWEISDKIHHQVCPWVLGYGTGMDFLHYIPVYKSQNDGGVLDGFRIYFCKEGIMTVWKGVRFTVFWPRMVGDDKVKTGEE